MTIISPVIILWSDSFPQEKYKDKGDGKTQSPAEQ